MNLLAVVPTAIFVSCFVSVFATVAITFVYVALMSIPMAKARRRILRESNEPFLSKEKIEKALAEQYPRLYSLSVYSPFIFIGTLILSWLVSFLVITLIGANTTVSW